jgi:hypothetical protein
MIFPYGIPGFAQLEVLIPGSDCLIDGIEGINTP